MPLIAMADSEEISQRDIDARRFLSVVIDAETHEARPGVFVVGDREPNVTDDSGACEIGHDESLARHDSLAIVVASDKRVVTGRSVCAERFETREIGEARREGIRRLGACAKKGDETENGSVLDDLGHWVPIL